MYVSYETDGLLREPGIEIRRDRVPPRRLDPKVRLKTGQNLFHQGDDGAVVYRVAEGVLRLSRVSQSGRQQVISFGYPGDIVGFPVGGRRSTDCEALTDAVLTPLPARLGTDRALDGTDAVDLAFLASAALGEIGKMQEHFMTLGRKSSREKVASFLLALMRRAGELRDGCPGFDLPMSRADIADFLGVRTETVSRAFTELRQTGVIALDNSQSVRILDPLALAHLAEDD